MLLMKVSVRADTQIRFEFIHLFLCLYVSQPQYLSSQRGKIIKRREHKKNKEPRTTILKNRCGKDPLVLEIWGEKIEGKAQPRL